MIEEDLSYISDDYTIGIVKNPSKFLRNHELLGHFSVDLMKEFIKKLPKDAYEIDVLIVKKKVSDRIKKGDLAPLHCDGVLLCPKKKRDDWEHVLKELDKGENK